jgi:hypothetical protein
VILPHVQYASKATLKIDWKLEEEEIIEGIWAIVLVVKRLAIARGWRAGVVQAHGRHAFKIQVGQGTTPADIDPSRRSRDFQPRKH